MKNLVLVLILTAILVSCMDQDEIGKVGQNGQAHMQVALVDCPADYDAVLIEVIGFEYKIDTSQTSGTHEDDDHDEENGDDGEEDDGGEGENDDEDDDDYKEDSRDDTCKVSDDDGYWVSSHTAYHL